MHGVLWNGRAKMKFEGVWQRLMRDHSVIFFG